MSKLGNGGPSIYLLRQPEKPSVRAASSGEELLLASSCPSVFILIESNECPRVGLLYDEWMCVHEDPEDEQAHHFHLEKLKSCDITKRCVVMDAKEASEDDLALVHTRDHISLIKDISSKETGKRNEMAHLHISMNTIFDGVPTTVMDCPRVMLNTCLTEMYPRTPENSWIIIQDFNKFSQLYFVFIFILLSKCGHCN